MEALMNLGPSCVPRDLILSPAATSVSFPFSSCEVPAEFLGFPPYSEEEHQDA